MGTTNTHLIDFVRIALTGALLFIGCAQAWISIRMRDRVGVWAGIWCVVAAVILGIRAWHNIGESPSHGVFVARTVLMCMLALIPLGVGAARALFEVPVTRGFVAGMLIGFAAILVIGLTDVVVESVPVRRVDVFGNAFWTAKVKPTFPLVILIGAAGAVYALRMLRNTTDYLDRTGRTVAIVAGGVLVAAATNDLLLARGAIESVQLGGFGAVAMALSFVYGGARRTSGKLSTLALTGQQRRRFIGRNLDAQERERKRIARELHDSTGQALTSLLVRLTALEQMTQDGAIRERVGELRGLAKGALEEVRRTARGLHPVTLEDLGFEEAVRTLATEIGRSFDMNVDVHMNGFGDNSRLSAGLELALYRIAQEALTNAARHSEAKTVSILVDRTDARVQLIVEDNGIGFIQGENSGLGLLGMNERAALFGGELTVESSRGGGTAIYVTIPLDT